MVLIKKIINTVEKYLIRTIFFSLLVIVIVQGIMTNDSLRLYLSWSERMEGQVVEYPVNSASNNEVKDKPATLEATSPETILILSIDDYSSLSRAIILVNGVKKGCFDKKEASLKLKAGDIVEIDATAYNFSVSFKVSDCSNNLAYPEKGTVYTSYQDIVKIGKIIVK
ncbi:MAG: hypothetical protein ACOX6E_02755 [Syntrophomonadaceae bacterium]|jgi:hypothetical protein